MLSYYSYAIVKIPRKAKRKRIYTQIKKDLTKTYCTKGPIAMANIIVNNARRIGLNVRADDVTPGDGSCFYFVNFCT